MNEQENLIRQEELSHQIGMLTNEITLAATDSPLRAGLARAIDVLTSRLSELEDRTS